MGLPKILRCSGALLVIAMAWGCSTDDSPERWRRDAAHTDTTQHPDDVQDDVADNDSGPIEDANNDDVGAQPDVAPDATIPPSGCTRPLEVGQTWTVDPGEPGQLYSNVTFDGEGLWVTYSRARSPDENTGIFATRLACDGSTDVAPFDVSQAEGQHYMPVVAYGYGQIYVAWATQDYETGAWSIFVRILSPDGTPTSEEPLLVTPLFAEEVISGLVWEVDIAALPSGAVIATSAGVDGTMRVVLQRLDQGGTLDGEAFFVHTEAAGANQIRPSVAAASDGTIHVAYTRESSGSETVVHTMFPPQAIKPDPEVPGIAHPTSVPNPMGSLAKSQGGPDDQTWLVFQVTTTASHDLRVKDAARPGLAPHYAAFGVANESNYRPSVDGSPTGGAVAWFNYTSSPQQNGVEVQRFEVAPNGGFFQANPVTVPLEDHAVPPYGPSIVHITGDLFAVSWSEGASAAQARVKTRILNLR